MVFVSNCLILIQNTGDREYIAQSGEDIITNGGRVLTITSLARTLEEAIKISLTNANLIHFSNKYFRKDIGFDVL
ncbi:MAG: phosphoribosylglycinamide synthetase C domain-containing protein [Solitalea-like symbiont of Acarus siro]